jgi:hypothetical protein
MIIEIKQQKNRLHLKALLYCLADSFTLKIF